MPLFIHFYLFIYLFFFWGGGGILWCENFIPVLSMCRIYEYQSLCDLLDNIDTSPPLSTKNTCICQNVRAR